MVVATTIYALRIRSSKQFPILKFDDDVCVVLLRLFILLMNFYLLQIFVLLQSEYCDVNGTNYFLKIQM
jgi:hypothetical protein